VTKPNNALQYFDTTRKGLAGDNPLCLKFALNLTHPFEKPRLRQVSAYNVSTVRDSEKSSIM